MTKEEIQKIKDIVTGVDPYSKLPANIRPFEAYGNPKISGYYTVYSFTTDIPRVCYYHSDFDRWYTASPSDTLPNIYTQSDGTSLYSMIQYGMGFWIDFSCREVR